MLEIDGSRGEGGGQVLRTSLALSLVCGRPVRVKNIRAGRPRPGLMRQHLAAVNAARVIGEADVTGAELHSREITFAPRALVAGTHAFDIGSAGSTTLILQAILPALLKAPSPSRVTLRGGTHNPLAPPFDFLVHALFPLLQRMGVSVTAQLHQHGFVPAGGGSFSVEVAPCGTLQPLELQGRGSLLDERAVVLSHGLPAHVAQREREALQRAAGTTLGTVEVSNPRSTGPGNVVMLHARHEHVHEVFTGFGEKGRAAEEVAAEALQERQRYLDSDAATGEHLCDQLLIFMAMAGGGSITASTLTDHARTQMELIPLFLPVRFSAEPLERKVRISVA